MQPTLVTIFRKKILPISRIRHRFVTEYTVVAQLQRNEHISNSDMSLIDEIFH